MREPKALELHCRLNLDTDNYGNRIYLEINQGQTKAAPSHASLYKHGTLDHRDCTYIMYLMALS